MGDTDTAERRFLQKYLDRGLVNEIATVNGASSIYGPPPSDVFLGRQRAVEESLHLYR